MKKNFADMYNRLDTDGRREICHVKVRGMHTRRPVKINSMIELVNKAYYSTVTELKFSVTVQDVAVVSSRMCPKITKDVASDVTRTWWLMMVLPVSIVAFNEAFSI